VTGHVVLGLCVSVSGWVYGTAGVSTERISDWGHVVLGLCVSVSGWVYGTAGVSTERERQSVQEVK
jgi:hypothetical protein